jgi:hypothetical protein
VLNVFKKFLRLFFPRREREREILRKSSVKLVKKWIIEIYRKTKRFTTNNKIRALSMSFIESFFFSKDILWAYLKTTSHLRMKAFNFTNKPTLKFAKRYRKIFSALSRFHLKIEKIFHLLSPILLFVRKYFFLPLRPSSNLGLVCQLRF